MGHDDHFLSRLDRVNRPTVEYALALYRDPELVRALLSSHTLPEGAPRVALSLGDDQRGPFVVVARDGHFVTCLGEGMYPRGLPVLPREHLDQLTERLGAARAMKAQAERQAGRHGALRQLFARVYGGGEFLSREEVVALRFWAPAIFGELWRIMLGFLDTAVKEREAFALLRDPGAGRHTERLQGFFHGTWAALHLVTILCDCDGARPYLDALRDVDDEKGPLLLPSLTWSVFGMGTAGAALRAAWINARLGRSALGVQKTWLRSDDSLWSTVFSAYALTAVASRQARSRAEVLKVADALGALDPVTPRARGRAALGQSMAGILRDPTNARRWAEETGRSQLFHHAKTFDPKVVGWSAPTPAGVPGELVVAALVDRTDTVFPSFKTAADYLHAVPTVAAASLGDLYYPHSVQSQFTRSWSTERALDWVRPWQDYQRLLVPKPVRRQETAGRNDPCTCGSGKKFKKCCGG